MADVQLNKGHVRIANRLFEAMIAAGFDPTEWAILRAVLRLTYGWRRRTVKISQPQLALFAGLKPESGTPRAAIRRLVSANVLFRAGSVYSINKNFESWSPAFSSSESSLAAFWGARPKSEDTAVFGHPDVPDYLDDDDDQSGSGEANSYDDESGSDEASDLALTEPTTENTPKTDLALPEPTVGSIRANSPLVTPLAPRLTSAERQKNSTTSTPKRDLDPRKAPTRCSPEIDDPSARFIASRHSASRDEWRREIATMAVAYGQAVVDRVCRDALLADKPLGAIGFRAYCATAKREVIAAAGTNGNGAGRNGHKPSERNDDVLRRFAHEDDFPPPPDEDDHG